MFDLGIKSFKTKSELKKFVSRYLQNNNEINDNDKTWIIKLLEYHPRWNEKSKNLKNIIIKKNNYNNNTFYLLKENNEYEDISYIKCIDGEKIKLNVLQALRYEISDYIKQFRKNEFKNNKKCICELCNKELDNDKNTHVDHIITFDNIVKDFLKKFGLNIEGIAIKSMGEYKIISDENVKEKWCDYHNNNCELRLLCKNCNLQRNKK